MNTKEMKSKKEKKSKKARTNNEYEQMLINFVKEEFKGVI